MIELIRCGVVVAVSYVAVIVAIVVDLRSGLLKARRLGQPRTSRGLRQTVDKAVRYLLMLISLTVIDALLIATAMACREYGWAVPLLPPLTVLGALALCAIETKSVIENTQDRRQYRRMVRDVTRALTSDDLRQLLDALRSLRPTDKT